MPWVVTFLGAEEMDRSVGRLMPSEYLDYLPLLGAFTVAGNRFTEKKTGYSLYNISAGVMTSELAGWFSRWIQAQPFHRVRSKVSWEVVDRPHRWKPFLIGFIFVGLPLNKHAHCADDVGGRLVGICECDSHDHLGDGEMCADRREPSRY